MKSLIVKSLSNPIEVGSLCSSTVSLCRSLVYVEDDDENDETRASHLI